MPEHNLCCHPFVGRSLFNCTRNDEEEADSSAENEGAANVVADSEFNNEEPANQLLGNVTAETEGSQDINAVLGDDVPETASVLTAYDRRRTFVIDDSPSSAPSSFFAAKSVMPLGDLNTSRSQVTAVAVREHGTRHFSNIIRFMYTVPYPIARSVETWIAVPRTVPGTVRGPVTHMLFSKRDDNGRMVTPGSHSSNEKDIIERSLLENCSVLTIGQICADWFLLRQFRVTATKAGKILLADNTVCNSLGLPPRPAVDVTPSSTLLSFMDSWFSTSRSTEAMKRGTANEGAVFAALSGMSFVIAVYECGMLAKNDADWLACSPDGVSLIDAKELGLEEGGEQAMHMLATVEIKTSIAQSSLDRALGRATVDVIKCTVGDATFTEYVPIEHTAQLLHQMLVLSINYSVYVSAAEVGIMYIVVFKCCNETLSVCRAVLRNRADPVVSWAHKDDPEPPQFVGRESRRNIADNLSFWPTVNAYVKEHGAFPPLKLFKHGAQSLYSKTKGGVDGSTQARCILRSSTSSFSWEQKIVSQTFKTLAVNSFIAWRMSGKEQLLQSMEDFGSLDHYRDALSGVQSFADFVLDVSRELLVHAEPRFR